MKQVDVYSLGDNSANIEQLSLKRDWMDATSERHAYQCFPISLANRLGWSISFPEEISFIWDGVFAPQPGHVTVLSGHKYVHPNRGSASISFNTGLVFDSKKNISLLTIPVPNQFIEGTQCFTTVISTSVLQNEFPVAWMINKPNSVITIPANTPIAAVIPISLVEVQDHSLTIKSGVPAAWKTKDWNEKMEKRSKMSQEKNSVGDWTHFYRDAVIDTFGEKMGEHESKKITLNVNKEV